MCLDQRKTEMTRLPDPELQPEFYTGVPMKRLCAWVLDMVVVIGISLLILPFTAFTGLFFFPFLVMCVGFIYRVMTLANGSATWGMRLMAIELRDQADQPLDLGLAFLHTLGYTISVSMLFVQVISMVLMGSSAYGRGLTDMVLHTTMVNRRRPV